MSDVLFRLRPDQLADLMRVGANTPHPGTPQDRPVPDVLRAMLCRGIPSDESHPDSPQAVLGRPCDELSRYRSIYELLFSANADLAALTILKDYGEELAEKSSSRSAKAAATAIYYAAIAAALLSHNEKITQHGYEDLGRYFAVLVAKPWVTADLKALFAEAQDACQSRAGEECAEEDG